MAAPRDLVRASPIIVSALFSAKDFDWLDSLRQSHFPPERNLISAHLTMFHHLPPSVEGELRRRLTALAKRERPSAVASDLLNLGRGVAIRIASAGLEDIRSELAADLTRLLTPQDAVAWRPHVTIQNKVRPDEARSLLMTMRENFHPRPVEITGLAAWWYRDGPWELISRHMFR